MKHFSYFLGKGSNRIKIDGDTEDIIAFTNESNDVVILARNNRSHEVEKNISLNDNKLTLKFSPHSINTIVFKETIKWLRL